MCVCRGGGYRGATPSVFQSRPWRLFWLALAGGSERYQAVWLVSVFGILCNKSLNAVTNQFLILYVALETAYCEDFKVIDQGWGRYNCFLRGVSREYLAIAGSPPRPGDGVC